MAGNLSLRTPVKLILIIAVAAANIPTKGHALNPSEIELRELRRKYEAAEVKNDLSEGYGGVKSDLSEGYGGGHKKVVLLEDEGGAKYGNMREKEEKEKERLKASSITTIEMAGTNDRPASQDAGYPTQRPGYETWRNLEVHPPASRRSAWRESRQLYLDFLQYYLPNSSTVNRDCKRDLRAIENGLVTMKEFWPLKLIDSWGKGADGIMDGYTNFMGSFYECLNLTVEEEDRKVFPADFQGQYCTISYQGRAANDSSFEESQPPHLKTPIISAVYAPKVPLSYASCIPSTCTKQEFKDSLTLALDRSGNDLKILQCQTRGQHHDLTAGEIFGIVFFSFIAIVLLSASVIDVWADYNPTSNFKDGPVRYLLVFSVPYNVKKLFHIDTAKNPQTIACLHGMRFLSICWVVLGHQYAYTPALAANILEFPEIANKVAFQMIANGDLSVDTFFFMSGLLVGLSVLSQMKKTGSFNAPIYYLHRIIRLLPPIAITVAFLATLSSLLVVGPLSWYYEGYIMKGCRHSWWIDISFVSNLIYPYLGDMNKENESASCMPHVWFVGVDMQLYLITPLILLPLYFWKKKGLYLLGAWTAASVIIPSAITGGFNIWPASMMTQGDLAASLDFNHKAYLMPWCRAGPYIAGIWGGYILYKAKTAPSITRIPKLFVLLGWISSTALALAVVFGIAKYNKVAEVGTVPEMSLAESVMYGGFHRAVWGLVLLWIVLACHWGYGGPINWFLSHPLWQPLSKLTYCIYLTSLPIQFAIISSTVMPYYYSNFMKVQETCGVLLVVILVSVALTLVAEAPILRLEKLILHPYMAARRNETATATSHHVTVEDEEEEEEDIEAEIVKSDTEDLAEHA